MNCGEFSKELHHKVGEEVVRNKADVLIAVGNDAEYIAGAAKGLGMQTIYTCTANIEAIRLLKDILKDNDAVLVKAANGMKFSEIIKALKNID